MSAGTPTMTIRLPLEVREKLTAMAVAEGVTLRGYIVGELTRIADMAPRPVASGVGSKHGRRPNRERAPMPEVVRSGPMGKGGVSGTLTRKPKNATKRRPAAVERDARKAALEAVQATCVHPRSDWKVFPYMTKCGLCDKRLR